MKTVFVVVFLDTECYEPCDVVAEVHGVFDEEMEAQQYIYELCSGDKRYTHLDFQIHETSYMV